MIKSKNVTENKLLIPIKPIQEIYSHLEEFKNNEVIQRIIIKLKYEMPIFYGIRGDGNCFYRSIALIYIESSLNIPSEKIRIIYLMDYIDKNKENIINVCSSQSLYKYKLTPKIVKKMPELLLQYLKLLYLFSQNEKINTKRMISDKLRQCFNKILYFDEAIILLFRSLTKEAALYFKQNPENEKEISIILSLLETNIDEIAIYGAEAEQIIIEILSKYLNICITVNYIEKNQLSNKENPILIQNVHGSGKLNLYVYYRSGHYDAGYCYNYAKEVYPDICEKNNNYEYICDKVNIIPEIKKKFVKNSFENNNDSSKYIDEYKKEVQ